MKKKLSVLVSFVLLLSILITSSVWAETTYTVKNGDVLWKIAEEYGLEWEDLAEYNNLENPHLIYAGQQIKIPSATDTVEEPVVEEPVVEEPVVEKPVAEEPKDTAELFELAEKGLVDGYKVINILHTNDVHGFNIEGAYDGMGAAKMMTFIKNFKESHKNVLLLDGGDALQGHNFATLTKGENSVKVMNALGYDAMVAGNHEFDYGKERILELAEMAEFPILGANIKDENGDSYLEAVKEFEVDGVKVAVVGITTPETKYKSHPDGTVGLTFKDPATAFNEVTKDIDADVVVSLAHLGVDESSDYANTSIGLADGAENLDVIIDGHSHTALETGKMQNGVLIGQAGEKGKNVGIIRILLKDNEIVAKEASLFTKEESLTLEDDAEILTLIEELNAVNKEIESEEVATAPFELVGEREVVRRGESNLGNLIATALKEETGADFALTNGGGIRASIDEGVVTKGEILTVLPFGNTVRVIELTGADVIAAIENGITDYPETKGAFPHIAGMTVKFDSSKEAGSRVVEVLVDGVELDKEATYTLATNDFLVAGGDGYTMFVGKKVVGELGAMDEILIDYVNENGFGAAVTDGRIQDILEDSAVEAEELDTAA